MNATPSKWTNVDLPSFSRLRKSTRYDVVVIGGGITGLTAAYLLKRSGKRVALVERYKLGSGDTRHTTAHLTAVTDLRLSKLAAYFGEEATLRVWRGGMAAIATIEAIAREAECEFQRVPGFLFLSLDGEDDNEQQLENEAQLARRCGATADYLTSIPFFERPGIRFAQQAKLHPFHYLSSLAKFITEGGDCAIFENSRVSDVEDDPLAVVVDERLRVECEHIVIATHVPLVGHAGMLGAMTFQSKLFPYMSYVLGAKAPPGTVPVGLYWDTTEPYYYLRVDAGGDHDYLIFGGCDVKTGQFDDASEPFARLRAKFERLVPRATVEHQWSGQVIETNDGLPYIGETASRQFAATGFAGNGFTFGTLGAMMACDWVLGRENPWSELFSPDRKKLRGGTWDYLQENIDYPYYMFRDRFSQADGHVFGEVAPGEGKLLDIDGKRVACFRAEDGNLSAVSATCTHMGCFVTWNSAEQTWDCPCHGSRFSARGEVIAGPAETSLEPISTAEVSPASHG
jgi:glycine/D-amino acid oxidase-like deaminating enzyme/nitrite reductase/ring-hydroxylating ferredoxin subunit